ncbi:hypothetical protein H6775_03675 [Candidatus Nomurabacteria bacterium]|nr:hypothetical protein [Candidatus Nomurabacteria bacterium]
MAYVSGPVYYNVAYMNLISASRAYLRRHHNHKRASDPYEEECLRFFCNIFKQTESRRIFNVDFSLKTIAEQIYSVYCQAAMTDSLHADNLYTIILMLIDYQAVKFFLNKKNIAYRKQQKRKDGREFSEKMKEILQNITPLIQQDEELLKSLDLNVFSKELFPFSKQLKESFEQKNILEC